MSNDEAVAKAVMVLIVMFSIGGAFGFLSGYAQGKSTVYAGMFQHYSDMAEVMK